MKRYVRSKGVYCPSCGRSRGVELLEEHNYIHPDFFIRCKHEGVLYKIENYGAYPTYDSPPMEE